MPAIRSIIVRIPPTAAVIAWACVAAGGLSLALWLLQYWTGQPESADRVLIPLAAGWLLVRAAGAARQLPRRPSPAGLFLIAPAAVLVPAAWYLYALVGPMPLLLWWLAVVGLAATAGLVLVQYGGRHLRAVAFPLVFLLFALPLPVSAQNVLQDRLQTFTTSAAGTMLSLIASGVQRKGQVLSLPSGDLGVVEACSGVRGVTAIVAVAAFVAYIRGFGLFRGTVLTLLALPVIAVANVVRVVLSGVLQEWLGPWVNQGAAHEALGVVTLLVGLGGVLAVSQLLRKKSELQAAGSRQQETNSSDPVVAARCLLPAACCLAVAAVGSVVAVWQAGQVIPGDEPPAPIETVATRIGPWVGADDPTDPAVRATLACDVAVHRVYRNPAGQQVHFWVLYWSAAAAVKDYIHHPDVCWPKQGWKPIGQDRKAVTVPAGEGGTPGKVELEMTVRRFERDGRRQVIVYWAQDGSHVWTAAEEERAHASWPTQRWVLDRLLSHKALERTPRLVVLVGADVWDASGYAEQEVEGFAREMAAELYRVCPWARPAAGE